MKRLFLTAMLLICWAASAFAAGDVLADFSARLSSSCVTFDYVFRLKTSAAVTGNGKVTYMSGRYKMAGNGLEVWCDGNTRWTIDHASKEAYLESVEDAGVDFMGNPALLLQAVGTMFTRSSEKQSSFDGKSATQVTLNPSVSGTGLKSVVLYFNSDSVPAGAEINAEDGTSVSISMRNFQFSKPASQSFVFDAGRLDSSYLVTDLR